jgi:dTDP-4-amino-4,6-dideoxygalactose transaminase
LIAAGIKPGDEVIAPAMTFIATVAAIGYAGAKPVLVDIDPKSYCIDPAKIEERITKKTRAIMPVHLYGQPADMDPILDIARRHNLIVIEDAAQAHGAEYKGRRCGSMGDIAGFSFYPGKNLGAYGEGGAVVTNHDAFAKTVRMLRDWGQEKKGVHVLKAFNYRMEGFQGAVLGVKMNHIEAWTEGRRRAAATYDRLLRDIPCIVPPRQMDYARHVYHVYGALVKNRDTVARKLGEAGIGTNVHYLNPIHLQPCLAELGHKRGDFPNAERLADEELSLPMYPELTEEQMALVAGTLGASHA